MTRAPWVSHFGFTRTPFSKTIPASQLCDRASHQEAVARIRFCIGESLLGVITGEVGVGKTVALRAATTQLDPTAHHVIYVATPTFGARGLYLTIVHALGARPRAQKAELIAQAQTLLAAEEHERRRRVVFIIDEAHLLAPDQLEELRLLTNAVIWTSVGEERSLCRSGVAPFSTGELRGVDESTPQSGSTESAAISRALFVNRGPKLSQ